MSDDVTAEGGTHLRPSGDGGKPIEEAARAGWPSATHPSVLGNTRDGLGDKPVALVKAAVLDVPKRGLDLSCPTGSTSPGLRLPNRLCLERGMWAGTTQTRTMPHKDACCPTRSSALSARRAMRWDQ
jgi:hypothetical protein